MSESITLTQAANGAARFLLVIDSGGGLSNQQLLDAQDAANKLLDSWTNEQTQAMNLLIAQQFRQGLALIAQQGMAAFPLAAAYTLSNGVYTAAAYITPSFAPGPVLQFADLTTAINVPNGYGRALMLGLAIELAPQYGIQPTTLMKDLAEARAAASPMPGKIPTPGMDPAPAGG